MSPKNKTKFKSLDKIARSPKVVEIWDEDEDGLWVLLADGYEWQNCSCVHEWNCRDLIEAFKMVEGPFAD